MVKHMHRPPIVHAALHLPSGVVALATNGHAIGVEQVRKAPLEGLSQASACAIGVAASI